jgi:hypothetical protein
VHLTIIVLSSVLIVTCWSGAAGDFAHHPAIVASMNRLGMPANFEMICGYTKVAAGVGLLAGLLLDSSGSWLTILTASCLALYFALASLFHLRVHDSASHTTPALFLMMLSLALAIVAS